MGRQGQQDQATEAAAKALPYADLTDSGFRYHPDVGLVGARYDNLKRERPDGNDFGLHAHAVSTRF
jgi:hypothetical protein